MQSTVVAGSWSVPVHQPVHAASRGNWFHRPSWWSPTGWTESGSSRRPASSAWCRWTASLASCFGSYSPETAGEHFYHPTPESLKMGDYISTWPVLYHQNMEPGRQLWECKYPTWTSKVKYFFRFLIIITRKGSLMPSVFLGSAGHVM